MKTKKDNKLSLRIYDEITLRNIKELQKTGAFDNLNDLLAKAVDIGCETLLGRMSKAKALADGTPAPKNCAAQLNSIEKRVKDLAASEDGLHVGIEVMETMLSTLYNVEVARIRGEEVSAELMDGGYFSDLPEQLQAVKDELHRYK